MVEHRGKTEKTGHQLNLIPQIDHWYDIFCMFFVSNFKVAFVSSTNDAQPWYHQNNHHQFPNCIAPKLHVHLFVDCSNSTCSLKQAILFVIFIQVISLHVPSFQIHNPLLYFLYSESNKIDENVKMRRMTETVEVGAASSSTLYQMPKRKQLTISSLL